MTYRPIGVDHGDFCFTADEAHRCDACRRYGLPIDDRYGCGYTVVDSDGIEQPCDRPTTGWRWYQNASEHEDRWGAVCDLHTPDDEEDQT